jgi:hypothetical protein
VVPTGCLGDFQCEKVTGATSGRCFPPAYLKVTVMDPTAADRPIAGARVVAVDADTHAAAAPAATTAEDGTARIAVTWPRSQPDTAPSRAFAVRVSAAGYAEHPGAMRTAIPVSVQRDPQRTLSPTEVQVRIMPLEGGATGSITGTVLASDGQTPAGGVLVLAEASSVSPPLGFSSVSDAAGAFQMFNVEVGSYLLSAYVAGQSFPQQDVSVMGGAVHDLKLVADATPLTATVRGQVDIVAGGGATTTTVVLRTRSTRDVPPGLLVAATGGQPFEIPGVGTGTFEAVAAYGNDGLVLDPDPNIAGTEIQEVSVIGAAIGQTISLDAHFKVTSAVAILGPGETGGLAPVSAAPTFRWKDYPGADSYTLLVSGFATGVTWTKEGLTTTSYPYDGPELTDGYIYQWQVEAWASTPDLRPISRSEDQLGVFLYRPKP